ncbi:alpha/beta hydrolase [Teredinibacter haidensis]|uniref:alpha/beta hydrolase n=1 Tax=Teredinibacter haidensis TaxID=2731755 RepID=UPI0009489084|nr:alpha/beta hydrolase [Teredinibacter haidensis]
MARDYCYLSHFVAILSLLVSVKAHTISLEKTVDNDKPNWPVFEHIVYTHPNVSSQVGEITFTECRVSHPLQATYRNVECGSLQVPENYSDPQGRHIKLFVARIKATGKKAHVDAFVPIAGGPGAAASESYLFQGQGFDKILQQRDIYIIDQRGTGKSHRLNCPNMPEQAWAMGSDGDVTETLVPFYRECLEQLAADPSQYTTSVAVRDYENIRQALGLEQWNIYGASYGSRVAQHYLRRHEQSLRTVILDAVVHPQLSLGPNIVLESERALRQMTERCEHADECKQHFPGLREGVDKLLEQLKGKPKDITLDSISTGERESFQLTHGHLIAFIRFSLYSQDSVALVPLILREAYANNNFIPLARNAQLFTQQMGSMISLGMHSSVICSEDQPYLREEDIDREQIAATYIGDGEVELFYELCKTWPSGPVDEEFKKPVKSEKPVLLLSGSADPITPPAFADLASEHLSNSLHIVAQGLGHGLASKGCIPTLMAKFVDKASVKELNAECVKRYTPTPFFIDFNGPSP